MAYVNRRPYFYDGIFSGKLGMSIISVDGGGGGDLLVDTRRQRVKYMNLAHAH